MLIGIYFLGSSLDCIVHLTGFTSCLAVCICAIMRRATYGYLKSVQFTSFFYDIAMVIGNFAMHHKYIHYHYVRCVGFTSKAR